MYMCVCVCVCVCVYLFTYLFIYLFIYIKRPIAVCYASRAATALPGSAVI